MRGGCDRGARGGIGGACSWAGRTSAENFFSSAASIVAESHLHNAWHSIKMGALGVWTGARGWSAGREAGFERGHGQWRTRRPRRAGGDGRRHWQSVPETARRAEKAPLDTGIRISGGGGVVGQETPPEG